MSPPDRLCSPLLTVLTTAAAFLTALRLQMLARVLGVLFAAMEVVKGWARSALLFFLPARRLAGDLGRLRTELKTDPSPAK